MFMNDMFRSDFGAAYPITISVIQRVPDHRNARQVRSDHELKADLDIRMSRGARWPSLHSLRPAVIQSKGLGLAIMDRKKQPSRLNAALRLL
jgi:hypothetical protein